MNNWATKKLGEVTKIVGGGTPSTKNNSYWGGDNFWATPRDLAQLKIADINSTARTITELGLEYSSAELLPVGSVILSTRAPIGYVAITTEPMAINQGCRAFICGEEVNNKYLYYFFVISKNYLQSLGRGATFTEVNKSTLENIKIPLPPFKTQKQIVERLDKIAEAQKLNDGLIQKSDELFQSLLHQELNPAGPADAKAMAGKKDWSIKRLGEVFERSTESVLPTKQPDQEFNFIGLENIESNTGQIVGLNSTKGKLIKSTKTVFRKNDVLYGKLRPYLNKVWLADTTGICSTDIWVLRAKQEIISPLLLSSILRQQRIVMKSSASMAGANLPRANKNVFDSIKIQIPPLEAQKQIVAKLSAVQDYKKQLLEQKSKLKELFNSVLARSMNSGQAKSFNG